MTESTEPQAEGCQILLIDSRGRVLLQLRDEKDGIPFPGMWAIPGGMLDAGEIALECIAREVREELGLTIPLSDVRHLATRCRSYGVEHTFTAPLDVDAASIELTEGQEVRWFTSAEAGAMTLAYEDSAVLAEFLHPSADTPSPGRNFGRGQDQRRASVLSSGRSPADGEGSSC